MAASRDDFIIAIRSAFLKKATKQRFSLFALMSFSIALIVLSNLNFFPPSLIHDKSFYTLEAILEARIISSRFFFSLSQLPIISSVFP